MLKIEKLMRIISKKHLAHVTVALLANKWAIYEGNVEGIDRAEKKRIG